MGRHGWGEGGVEDEFPDDPLAPWDRPGGAAGSRGDRRRPGLRWVLRAAGVLVVLALGVVSWRIVGAGDAAQGVAVAPPPQAATERGSAGAEPTAQATPTAPAGSGQARPLVGSAPGGAGGSGDAGGGSRDVPSSGVTVHVVGAVKHPGLYTLGPGARAADAVKAAGGATARARLEGINLAAPAVDGSQLRVPDRDDPPESAAGSPGSGTGTSGTGAAGAVPGGAASGSGGGRVRINTATAAELEGLPGIGPSLAQRLIDFRTQNGPFRSSADLDAVPGIGPAMLAKLLPAVSYD